jgi:hypothetical protein
VNRVAARWLAEPLCHSGSLCIFFFFFTSDYVELQSKARLRARTNLRFKPKATAACHSKCVMRAYCIAYALCCHRLSGSCSLSTWARQWRYSLVGRARGSWARLWRYSLVGRARESCAQWLPVYLYFFLLLIVLSVELQSKARLRARTNLRFKPKATAACHSKCGRTA